MTRSPDFKVLMYGLLDLYCSATSGDTLDLIPPVPSPTTIIPTTKPGNEAPLSMADGMDVAVIIIKPIK